MPFLISFHTFSFRVFFHHITHLNEWIVVLWEMTCLWICGVPWDPQRYGAFQGWCCWHQRSGSQQTEIEYTHSSLKGSSFSPFSFFCFLDWIMIYFSNFYLIWIWKQALSFSDCVQPQILHWVSSLICSKFGFAWISNCHNI